MNVWPILVIAVVVPGVAGGCRTSAAVQVKPATASSIPSPTLQPASPLTRTPASILAVIPTALPPLEGAGPGEVPFAYEFLTTTNDLPAGSVVIYQDPRLRNRLNFLTWDGETGSLFEIEVPARTNGISSVFFGSSRESAGHVVLGLDKEVVPAAFPNYVVVDMEAQQAWGYHHGCPNAEYASPGSVVGRKYWAYRCNSDLSSVFLVLLENPAQSISLHLPRRFDSGSPMLWVDEENLLVIDAIDESAYCIGRVSNWEPECGVLPFSVMSLSADGQWLEVRELRDRGSFGLPFEPERIGVIATECLAAATALGCEPVWAQANGVVEDWPGVGARGERTIDSGGAFAPDGSQLLLLSSEEPSGLTPGTVPAEVWVLEVGDRALRRLASIPLARLKWPTFRKASMSSNETAPLFSPDGEWVLLEDGFPITEPGPIYKMSVKTGETRRLVPLAGEVLGTLNVP